MTTTQLLELALAAALLIGGVILYRRRSAEDPRQGSQGAVFLLAVGAIVAIHALRMLDYRPSGFAP